MCSKPCKVVNASKFVHRSAKLNQAHLVPKASQRELAVHRVWYMLRQRHFRIPQALCSHSDACAQSSWEVYDANMAGCTLCGSMHLCMDGACPVEKSEEGFDICTVTGMCVKMISFSNEEFLDTVCMSADNAMCDTGGNISSVKCASDDGHALPRETSAKRRAQRLGAIPSFTSESTPVPALSYISGTGTASERNAVFATPDACQRADKTALPRDGVVHLVHSVVHIPALSRTSQQRRVHYMMVRQKMDGTNRCSVNKKNRYRSWVYHRVMNHPRNHVNLFRSSRQLGGKTIMPHDTDYGECVSAPIFSPDLPGSGPRDIVARSQRVSHGTSRGMDDASRVEGLIHVHVWDILCSASWAKSMQMEESKLASKRRSVVLRCEKVLLLHQEGVEASAQPRVDNASSVKIMVDGILRGVRKPASGATREEREAVCTWCVDAIHRHIQLVNSMCKGVVTEVKLKTTAVGLLYMMRQGIVVHELVVLPKLPALEYMLPLESHLELFFGVKAKCITETENVVKIILRSVTKQQLIDAGVARAALNL
jgi:hypothetical protein